MHANAIPTSVSFYKRPLHKFNGNFPGIFRFQLTGPRLALVVGKSNCTAKMEVATFTLRACIHIIII